jgi:hypothetical protein
MGNGLDAKHAFAFAVDLQGQLSAVQLEDRQIICRSLDRDFPFGRLLGVGEGDARLARLAGNVLVAIQDHLRNMAGGQVAFEPYPGWRAVAVDR